ncbi:hypothetical protein [Streptomyces sp. NPDC003032]
MSRTRSRTRLLRAGVLTAASAVLAGTALTCAAEAAPRPEPKESSKESVQVLDWLAVKQSDSRPDHPHVGVDWTVHSHLYTNHHGRPGKKIGDASAQCSVVDVRRHGYVAMCQRVLRTDKGGISLSDTIDHVGPAPHGGLSKVTGGTGKYREAEGQAEVTTHGDLTRFRILLDD